MEANQTKKLNTSSIEFWCAVTFFLSLVFNDTFGEAPGGLHLISKGIILIFMVLTLLHIILCNLKIPVSVIILSNRTSGIWLQPFT